MKETANEGGPLIFRASDDGQRRLSVELGEIRDLACEQAVSGKIDDTKLIELFLLDAGLTLPPCGSSAWP
jgi:hypothetical protein